MRGRTLCWTLGAAASITAIAAPAIATSEPLRALAQTCVPAANIEAVIDDSSSMLDNDPGGLRSNGLEQFITNPANAALTLGAIEFGQQGDTVFAPNLIGAGENRRMMADALRARVVGDGASSPTATGAADGGGTDYNDGLIRGVSDNPTAAARIFLTDGAHNENEYANVHRGGPRTYVIGLGIGADPTDADAIRLQLIADETGGRYFPDLQSTAVQAVFNTISLSLACQADPVVVAMPTFSSTGQAVTRAFKPSAQAKRVSLVVNWSQATNRFSLSGVKALGRRSKVLATSSGKGKPKKLRMSAVRGETFQTLTINRVKGMRKVRFKVRAEQLLSGEAPIVQAASLVPVPAP